jgi:hypothetical protein
MRPIRDELRNFAYKTCVVIGALTLSVGISYAATTIGTNIVTDGSLNVGSLFGVATSSPGSLFSVGGITNFTAATSTFYSSGGVNLKSGCFAVNGTCVGSGGGSSGAMTLVSTQTASNSASLQWTGLTGQLYQLRCSAIVPASDGTDLFSLQFGTGGGTPTWLTSYSFYGGQVAIIEGRLVASAHPLSARADISLFSTDTRPASGILVLKSKPRREAGFLEASCEALCTANTIPAPLNVK